MFLKPSDFAGNPPHPGSAELKKEIEFVEGAPIPFMKKYGWDRWGFLYIFIDYVLFWLQGDIVEIGIGESSFGLTYLSRKYNRKIYHCDLQVSDYENLFTVGDFFDDSNVLYAGSSDDFFKEVKFTKIAIGFIDGDHMYDKVKADFENIFSLIQDNGFIFLHDLFPVDKEETAENRSGDGYKFRQELERNPLADVLTLPFGFWNAGLTVVRRISINENEFRKSGRMK